MKDFMETGQASGRIGFEISNKRKFSQAQKQEGANEADGSSLKRKRGTQLCLNLSLLPSTAGTWSSADPSQADTAASSSNVNRREKRNKPPLQLTIFYNGSVHVYYTTPEKAQEIISMAEKSSEKDPYQNNNKNGEAAPLMLAGAPSPATQSAAATPRYNTLRSFISTTPIPMPADGGLPLATRSSLQRFIAKRNGKFR